MSLAGPLALGAHDAGLRLVREGLALEAHVAGRARDLGDLCTLRAGRLYKDRSWLYRGRCLQPNVRWNGEALAEIYTMHSILQLLESIIENCGKKDLDKTTPKI